MNNQKKWYQSRSVWSGIAKIIAGLIASISSLLVGDLDPQSFTTGVIAMMWGIYDIILRFSTDQPIKK